jgi:hypothetical protein
MDEFSIFSRFSEVLMKGMDSRGPLWKGSGGERGIRTPDRGFSPYNGLANRRLQPLGHLSALLRIIPELSISVIMRAIKSSFSRPGALEISRQPPTRRP